MKADQCVKLCKSLVWSYWEILGQKKSPTTLVVGLNILSRER
jgi:hypothetical protein